MDKSQLDANSKPTDVSVVGVSAQAPKTNPVQMHQNQQTHGALPLSLETAEPNLGVQSDTGMHRRTGSRTKAKVTSATPPLATNVKVSVRREPLQKQRQAASNRRRQKRAKNNLNALAMSRSMASTTRN